MPPSDLIRIVAGYDRRLHGIYHVLEHSIVTRSSLPVSITPLHIDTLGKLMWRERNPLQSTDFSFSRFLTPYLCGYEGWAIFMDNDMLVLDDIAKLWNMRDDNYAVMAVKHAYTPKDDTKFLGAAQTKYEKKNWSSVMLMNCAKCKMLTPEYVNTASGLELHRFHWLKDDNLIGGIPLRWNFLVGEYDPIPVSEISNLHYTLGGPYFNETRDCDYADLWLKERDEVLHVAQMGKKKQTA